MTSFGPETPVPFCVTSERFLKKALNKIFEHSENRKKGQFDGVDYHNSIDYENKYCETINKFLDIDCTDEILFIRAQGDEDPSNNKYNQTFSKKSNSKIKNWPEIIQEMFCLSKPVDLCEISFKEVSNESNIFEYEPKFKFEFFNCENKTKKYDKIIMKNCLKYFDDNHKYFCKFIMNFFKEQAQTRTSLLIIQRCSDLNTLPFHKHVNENWKLNDARYATFIETMQNEFFSVKFDIEVFKYLIDCKSTWYTQLKNKEPYPLNQNSLLVDKNLFSTKNELVSGIRELNEGVFKYQQFDDYIELSDRMLFIGAFQQFNREATLAERIKQKKDKARYNPKLDFSLDNEIQKLHMEITPELRPIINSINFKKKK